MKKDILILLLVLILIVVVFFIINTKNGNTNLLSYENYNDNSPVSTTQKQIENGVMGAEVEGVTEKIIIKEDEIKVVSENDKTGEAKKNNEGYSAVYSESHSYVNSERHNVKTADSEENAEMVRSLLKELMKEIKTKANENTLIDNTTQKDYDALFFNKLSSLTGAPIQFDDPEQDGYLEFTIKNKQLKTMTYRYNEWTYNYTIESGQMIANSD